MPLLQILFKLSFSMFCSVILTAHNMIMKCIVCVKPILQKCRRQIDMRKIAHLQVIFIVYWCNMFPFTIRIRWKKYGKKPLLKEKKINSDLAWMAWNLFRRGVVFHALFSQYTQTNQVKRKLAKWPCTLKKTSGEKTIWHMVVICAKVVIWQQWCHWKQ